MGFTVSALLPEPLPGITQVSNSNSSVLRIVILTFRWSVADQLLYFRGALPQSELKEKRYSSWFNEQMDEISHRTLEVNGIKMHIAEQGKGPLVLLLHGFPGLWYSWRHQIPVIAKAGYHVVVPDQRGYGQTEAPADPSKYTFLHLVGDVVGLIEALGEKQVYLIGHDWGAVVTWMTAVLRPDLLKCVITLSVGFVPRDPKLSLLGKMKALCGERVYMQEWQEPGKAEADFSRDIKQAFLKLYSNRASDIFSAPEGKSVLESIPSYDEPPKWITHEELQVYVDTFKKTGFTGGLNWYRNIDRSWELMAPWTHVGTPVPALVIIGDHDLGFGFAKKYHESPLFKTDVPNGEFTIVPGCAHFYSEEAPEVVNSLILDYLKKH
ncbi:hypothetical protein R1sor_011384 [Riccia sorocarpa]|uniref:AB hydrolase-1 domain-containing protein n=1 Tax=Riccia sorocarpa TaxID=122646 RepID=A0ABD3I0T2_9MARC